MTLLALPGVAALVSAARCVEGSAADWRRWGLPRAGLTWPKKRRLVQRAAQACDAARRMRRQRRLLRALFGRAWPSAARQFARRADPLAPPPAPSTFPPLAASEHFRFEVLHASSKPGSRARVGRLHTPHGVVDTPGFVPVGTNGALKAVALADADDVGMQLMFCNTYHLLLQPGPAPVEAAGGLHAFVGRPRGPLITDSGGFQIFSLQYGGVEEELKRAAPRRGAGAAEREPGGKARPSGVLRVSEEGVLFRSYRDGARVLLTPESSVAAQKSFGADIILPLDELPPYHITPALLAASVARSHRWEARSLAAHLADPRRQAMYGILHGGTDAALRAASADYLCALPFDGFAIGGALGRDRPEMLAMLSVLMPLLRAGAPVHLLGVGDEESLVACAPLGIDTFDSAFPTRLGRHGTLLTSSGRVTLRKAEHAAAFRPPDEACGCATCRTHSLAYLHHLWRAREPVLASLAAVHNIAHTLRVAARLRSDILADRV